MQDHLLGRYEVFASEGLHDVKEHVKHVLEELPAHLNGKAKTTFVGFLSKETKSRALLRGSDYRRIVTMLPSVMQSSDLPDNISVLINTLAELAKLLYATDSDRTPRMVLRLYNVAFIHAVACVTILDPPQILSRGQMFGLYFHKLTSHSPEETRIVSGYARLTEQDERQFKELRLAPTSGRPTEVAKQLLEKLQVSQGTTFEQEKIFKSNVCSRRDHSIKSNSFLFFSDKDKN